VALPPGDVLSAQRIGVTSVASVDTTLGIASVTTAVAVVGAAAVVVTPGLVPVHVEGVASLHRVLARGAGVRADRAHQVNPGLVLGREGRGA